MIPAQAFVCIWAARSLWHIRTSLAPPVNITINIQQMMAGIKGDWWKYMNSWRYHTSIWAITALSQRDTSRDFLLNISIVFVLTLNIHPHTWALSVSLGTLSDYAIWNSIAQCTIILIWYDFNCLINGKHNWQSWAVGAKVISVQIVTNQIWDPQNYWGFSCSILMSEVSV